MTQNLDNRQHTLFTSTVSGVKHGEAAILGKSLTQLASKHTLAYLIASLWLGQEIKSQHTEQVFDYALKLLLDHGPYVSGAVNTMITARAGKDIVSALSSGLLTIGPRFGGAINNSAQTWFKAVQDNIDPAKLVEDFATKHQYIAGIGHRYYRLDNPDPRVKHLINLVADLATPHLDFAQQVASITLTKKPNLILNVDGCLGAILLDLLIYQEKLTSTQIKILLQAEFFNAIFVLARSVGFIAHYLDQRRLNEPLFRLTQDQVLTT